MMSPAVRPNLASTPASAWIRSSRMKSTSAPVSGCGSVTITTSNACRLVLAAKREIDRRRQGPGRRQTLEGQVELGRRAVGLMMAVEAGQIGLRLDRRHEACGLDDEDRRLVRQRQRVAAVGAGDGDVAAVGDEHAGEPGIGGAGHARAVAVLEHDAGDLARDRRVLAPRARCRLDRRQRKPARRADQHLAPGHSIAVMLGHFSTSASPSSQEMARA